MYLIEQKEESASVVPKNYQISPGFRLQFLVMNVHNVSELKFAFGWFRIQSEDSYT